MCQQLVLFPVSSFWEPGWRTSLCLRQASLVVKRELQESWQSEVIVLAEFCLKPAHLTSAHTSLAKVGQMAKLDINGMAIIGFPAGEL